MEQAIRVLEDQKARGIARSQIRVKGKNIVVPSAVIDGKVVVVSGRLFRMASIKDEDYIEGESVTDPNVFVKFLKESGLHADLLTFTQKFPDIAPKFGFHMEWDNVAAIPLSNPGDWWNKRISTNSRKNVSRSARRGLRVEIVEPTDEFIRGVVAIYNETPIRQGRFFWHYGKNFDAIKVETLTYRERSVFLGAFYDDILVGFIKLVFVDKIGRLMQVISMLKHRDKYSNNALIAKAVEICEARGCGYLTYGRYTYGKIADSSLAEFKERNGFEKVLLPKYHIPLTLHGKVIMRLGMHNGMKSFLPARVLRVLLDARTRVSWLAAGLRRSSSKRGDDGFRHGAVSAAVTDKPESRKMGLSEND